MKSQPGRPLGSWKCTRENTLQAGGPAAATKRVSSSYSGGGWAVGRQPGRKCGAGLPSRRHCIVCRLPTARQSPATRGSPGQRVPVKLAGAQVLDENVVAPHARQQAAAGQYNWRWAGSCGWSPRNNSPKGRLAPHTAVRQFRCHPCRLLQNTMAACTPPHFPPIT